jgi:hypothetical protein
VREDSLTLFGFADDEQRELFGLLQSVGGIGPRMAWPPSPCSAPTSSPPPCTTATSRP